MSDADAARWNRNTHYHPLLIGLGPADTALDVGCGEGMLTRQLARTCGQVIGIDPDEPSIASARAQTTQPNVTFALGDVMTAPLPTESFDLLVSVLAIHHLDVESGLQRFAELLKANGRLGIVGVGRPNYPRDLPRQGVAFVATQVTKIVGRKQVWHHSAPRVWPPEHTEAQMEELSQRVLPGSIFRRRLHGRYSLTWTKR